MSGVPYLFASASGTLPLSQLDTNFSTPVTIGTTSVALGNTVTTLAGLTLSNPTISTPNFTTNVGIGTSTPTSLLQIVGATDPVLTVTASSSGSAWLSLNGISSAVVHNPNNVATVFTTNGAERMRITAAGNVGIGTSNPDSFYGNAVPLAVVKNQNAATILGVGNSTIGASATTQINMIGGTAYSFLYQQLADNNGSPFFANIYGTNVNFEAWNFGGTERMRITAAGNVGIGSTNPSIKLSVVANTNSNDGLLVSNASTGASAQAWLNVVAQGWTGVQLIQNQAAGTALVYTADNVSLLFATNAAERMRISATGNVGIGTSAPLTKLQVSVGNNDGVSLVGAATTYGPYFQISNTGTGGHNWNLISNGTSNGGGVGNLSIYDATGGGYVLITGNAADSRLGVNTSSPQGTAHLNVASGAASMYLSVAGTQTGIVYANSTDMDIYSLGSIPLILGTNATERMRISAAGNVGIGTTTPDINLRVSGTYAEMGTLDGTVDSRLASTSGGGAGIVGTYSNNPMTFYSNGTERMRISALGNVGIGTSNPDSFYGNAVPLAVVKNQNAVTTFGIANGTSGSLAFTQIAMVGGTSNSFANLQLADNSGSPYFQLTTGSAVSGISMIANSNGVKLAINGTSWTSLSDARLKDIIEPITNAASKVSTLRSVIGKFKTEADGVRRSFLLAQDVQAVLPEAVNVATDAMGTLELSYTDVIPLLVAAINELTARITNLETKAA